MQSFEGLQFFNTESTMSDICDSDNILLAWAKVRDKNGGAGVDGVTVAQFERNMEDNLISIQEELLSGTYQPRPLLRVYIDKGNGKKRALSIPTVRDRIVQQAITVVLTPKLDAIFEDCSYGFRKGKGRKQAIDHIISLRDAGYHHVVDADIENYFDSIVHSILIQRLSEFVPEDSALRLVAMLLTSEIQESSRKFTLKKGIPQGSPLSPLLSNLYLDLFDKVMCERDYKLIRYADDFVILEQSKATAQQALQLTQHLLTQLKLTLKAEKTSITTFDQGFQYLGVFFEGQNVMTKDGDTLKFTQSTRQIDTHKLIIDSTIELEQESQSSTSGQVSGEAGVFMNNSQWKQSQQTHQPNESVLMQQLRAMQEEIQKLRTEISHQTGEESSTDESPITVNQNNQSMGTSRLLSTLYIQEQGSTLRLSEKRFIVKVEKQMVLEVPAIKIAQIVIFGRCHITTPAMTFCLKGGIAICFLSQNGSYYGRLAPPTANQVLLQQQQFLASANPDLSLKLAKAFVEGKIHNQRILLQRRQRKLNLPEIQDAIDFLAEMMSKCAQSTTLDELRGYEGTSSGHYFKVFGLLLDDAFNFSKRIKHPPPDPVNAMLSFGYTLLFQNIYSLVETHNLHPYCGHLHALRDGHPALVSDLIEEFRALIVDPLVIYLINKHIIKPTDFEPGNDNKYPCLLTTEARKTFVQHFENKIQTTVTHPHSGYTVDYRRCLDLQITQLVQFLRGERERYLPMKGKA